MNSPTSGWVVLTRKSVAAFHPQNDSKVVKMTDRVGNSLTFGSDGIIHSSGKSVKFVRDAWGRIIALYDPLGLDGQPSRWRNGWVWFRRRGAPGYQRR
jgi:hypothetical protein